MWQKLDNNSSGKNRASKVTVTNSNQNNANSATTGSNGAPASTNNNNPVAPTPKRAASKTGAVYPTVDNGPVKPSAKTKVSPTDAEKVPPAAAQTSMPAAAATAANANATSGGQMVVAAAGAQVVPPATGGGQMAMPAASPGSKQTAGGQMVTPTGGQSGQTVRPAGGQMSMPTGGQMAMPTGGQMAMPTGGQMAMPTGGQMAMPTGGQMAMPTGGQMSMAAVSSQVGQMSMAQPGPKQSTGQMVMPTGGQMTMPVAGPKPAGGQMQMSVPGGGQMSMPMAGVQMSMTGGQMSMVGGQMSMPMAGGPKSVAGGQMSMPMAGGQMSMAGGQMNMPMAGGQMTMPMAGGQMTMPMAGGQMNMAGGQMSMPMAGGQINMAGGQMSMPMAGGQMNMAGGQMSMPMAGGQINMAGGQMSMASGPMSMQMPKPGEQMSMSMPMTGAQSMPMGGGMKPADGTQMASSKPGVANGNGPGGTSSRGPSRTGSTKSRNGDNGERVHVEFFVSERHVTDRLQAICFKRKSSIVILLFSILLKLASCFLYVLRLIHEGDRASQLPCEDYILTALNMSFQQRKLEDGEVDWEAIVWIKHPLFLWASQVAIAVFTLSQTLLIVYLRYKGTIWKVLTFGFFLELVTTLPFIITLFNVPWKDIFIPVFLNCWLARMTLEDIFNHQYFQNSQTAFSKQVTLVMATLFCFVFTSACGFQHIQRGGQRQLNILESIYFVIISLATVGYGDVVPDIWPSQLFVIVMVVVALIVIPRQLESLAVVWMERQKMGGTYDGAHVCAGKEKHVVVCTSSLLDDKLMDFVNEFYSHRHLQDHYVIIMTPTDLDPSCKQILHYPLWSQRLIYMKGSCLSDRDMLRAKMKDADACFLLGVTNTTDKETADAHTVLRSWAVQDYAPNVPQYVQIFRPENKTHVKFAEFATCEDEFKYAMLAYNCMIPGSSSLFTLLLHTSKGEEGQMCHEAWLRLYGKCSGNEIYSIKMGDSVIFGEYEGRPFTEAAGQAHRKFGVTLIGVQPMEPDSDELIMLNPGNVHMLKTTDILFYLSITREEDMMFLLYRDRNDNGHDNPEPVAELLDEEAPLPTGSWVAADVNDIKAEDAVVKMNGVIPHDPPTVQAGPTVAQAAAPKPAAPVADSDPSSKYYDVWAAKKKKDFTWLKNCEKIPIITDYPPVTPYLGTSPTLCYTMKTKKQLCCLEIAKPCDHSTVKTCSEYKWGNPAIIIVAETASGGVFNFLVPLRTHYHLKSELRPIVLLLGKAPPQAFLDCIAWFPLVYWRQGTIDSLDDLLRAGINFADNVVVLNKESETSKNNEEDMSDCNTIVAVQAVFKFYPNIKITTELSQSNNMRFMQFQAKNAYTLYLADVEKKEKARGSNISFMFRMQFAGGSVFSASMVDTLLYQAFVKPFLITVVRLLLGIDQTPGSGFLTSLPITKEEPWSATYGTMFHHLCSTNGDIPIAIYRTHSEPEQFNTEETKKKNPSNQRNEKVEINNMIRSRMTNLTIKGEKYRYIETGKNEVSYVVINPDADLDLEKGDIIYVIKAVPTVCAFR